ncbi:MAG: N-acetylmuramoyl-L-alanine amidase [Acidobacteria bacterium]|nr:N-acetylmuramoyl-L-alanine amidase [Acidobacteriota bacterium]
MPLRRGIFLWARGLLAATLTLAPFSPAWPQADDEPETQILSHEDGLIVMGRQREPLPWARSSFGPLVALAPVVEVLGGELEIGPLGEAHTLQVAGREVVLGPLGRIVLVDGEMHSLSIRPWLEPEPELPEHLRPKDDEEDDGDADSGSPDAEEPEPELPPIELPPRHLYVPVDALVRAYPEEQGYRFDFDRRRGRLQVDRIGERRLAVEVDRVHDLGATTLVVTFSGRPRYRVDDYRGGVRLRLLSGVLEPRPRVRLNDPLVRWLEVRERSIDIGLAPRAEASEPYILGRPPRVQLVMDITRDRMRSTPRALSRRAEETGEFRIVLDPGHGGADTGVSSPDGVTEKDLVLEIARELGSHLADSLDARVVLTRTDDAEVALENRTAVANQRRADLFLSLHVSPDSPWAAGDGFQTYVLDPPPALFETADDEEEAPVDDDWGEPAGEDDPEPPEAGLRRNEQDATDFEEDTFDDLGAEAEDAQEIHVAVPALELWERAQDSQLERSRLLARLIQSHVSDVLEQPNRRVSRAPLRVLTGASMPAVLIELGSLGGDEEEEGTPLLDEFHRRELIEAIGRAIRLYRGVVAGAGADRAADGAGS